MTVPIYDMTDVWNNVTTTFTGFKLAITNTASAVGSKALEVKIGANSVLEYTTSQNGTFTIRAQPPHGQNLSITPRSDSTGGTIITGAGNYNFDQAIGIGAGSAVNTSVIVLSSIASGTSRSLSVNKGIINLPPVTAPSAPTNGDIWTDASGMYVRIAGVTYKLTATAV